MKSKGFKKLSIEERKLRKAKLAKQKRKAKKLKTWGVKLWSVKKADTEYSKWLRELREHCELCGEREGLTCSHYIGRKAYAVRFIPLNTQCFCGSCHAKWEDRKQFEYRDWMIAKYGEEAHENLKQLSKQLNGSQKAVFNCMKLLGAI